MKRYLVGGYKMMPANPTFIEARDAILAVMEAQDPLDHELCLHGFAKRGAGVGAVAPDRYSEDNAGVGRELHDGAARRAERGAPVVEYYHAAFDHYFVTDIPGRDREARQRHVRGWSRTGEVFERLRRHRRRAAPRCAGSSARRSGCAARTSTRRRRRVRAGQAERRLAVRGRQCSACSRPARPGTCPAGTQPVYRALQRRPGRRAQPPLHDQQRRRAQRCSRKGWIAEGYGAAGVIMCAPV